MSKATLCVLVIIYHAHSNDCPVLTVAHCAPLQVCSRDEFFPQLQQPLHQHRVFCGTVFGVSLNNV
jgi:hypothetical protein